MRDSPSPLIGRAFDRAEMGGETLPWQPLSILVLGMEPASPFGAGDFSLLIIGPWYIRIKEDPVGLRFLEVGFSVVILGECLGELG